MITKTEIETLNMGLRGKRNRPAGIDEHGMLWVRGTDAATRHTHKAISEKGKDYGWTVCVTPHECAANPHRQVAHGNIIRHDVCSCGATRQTEINGGRSNYGPWETGEQE